MALPERREVKPRSASQFNPHLKRKFGPSAAKSQVLPTQSSIFDSSLLKEEAEPPLKKYKSLFDETDPDKIAQSGMEEYKNMFSQLPSVDEEESGLAGHGAAKPTPLAALREEEEETTQSQMRAKPQALKRKSRDDEDEDVEMEDAEDARQPKRRALDKDKAPETTSDKSSDATTKKPASKSAQKPMSKAATKSQLAKSQAAKSQDHTNKGTGAAPGQPDTDEAFLRAVASTKRGKKLEDEFDREFNNLKISKPDLEMEAEREEWALLEQFGDDSNMRGNFMVIIEMDVYKKEQTPLDPMRVTGTRMDWEGRPNFKKFKHVCILSHSSERHLFIFASESCV